MPKATITICMNKPSYYAGEVLTGKLCLRVSARGGIKARTIEIVFNGS